MPAQIVNWFIPPNTPLSSIGMYSARNFGQYTENDPAEKPQKNLAMVITIMCVPDRQIEMEIRRITLSTISPNRFPYLMKLPEIRAPVMAPKLVEEVTAVVQNFS